MCGMPDHRITVDVRGPLHYRCRCSALASTAYPAQRGKTSGVVTVSAEMFYFTPLLPGPRLEIPVQDIVGIKKVSPKGISIRVKDANQEGGERNEKFWPVYERDELFGRLVGTGGKKWTRI